MKKIVNKLCFILLFLFFLVETMAITSHADKWGAFFAPLLWTFSGFATSCLFYLFFNKKTTFEIQPGANKQTSMFITLLLHVILANASLWYVWKIFHANPIDPTMSDIIPAIQHYTSRFLAGQPVYTPIDMNTYWIFPNYFPAQWIPFAISDWLNIDFRWIPMFAFIGITILHSFRYSLSNEKLAIKIVKTILPYVLLILFAKYLAIGFAHTIELLPIVYYLLLAYAITRENKWLLIISLVLILLSRYSFLIWLPVLAIVWIDQKKWRSAWLVAGGVTLGILLLFGPYLIDQPDIPVKAFKEYNNVIQQRWLPDSWQAAGEVPHTLNQNHGFGYYFYVFGSKDHKEALSFMTYFQRTVLLSVMILSIALYYFVRKKIDYRLYLLITLKVYLIVFYGLIQAPFPYLFMLPLFFTLPLWYELDIEKAWKGQR